ncbi:nickel-dependent hydrogenase large subunit, partial [Candidatus Bipolaricaulota bacterium]|nr:nickel-dependent hydrogenase large subunit [Candidatus Bipolaricaulota bacterium]
FRMALLPQAPHLGGGHPPPVLPVHHHRPQGARPWLSELDLSAPVAGDGILEAGRIVRSFDPCLACAIQ